MCVKNESPANVVEGYFMVNCHVESLLVNAGKVLVGVARPFTGDEGHFLPFPDCTLVFIGSTILLFCVMRYININTLINDVHVTNLHDLIGADPSAK